MPPIILQAFAVLLMLGILSVLIIVHEFGHFSVARFFGFQTPVFGIGLPFGPSWTIGSKWGTEFRIHACLLGGYVAIPELGDESNAKEENYGVPLKPFRKFPIWQRALVAVAGVTFNVIFAYFVMIAMLYTLGVPSKQVVVANFPPTNPIAMNAGVKVGDRIAAIDDQEMTSSDSVVRFLKGKANQTVVLHLLRPKHNDVNIDTEDEKSIRSLKLMLDRKDMDPVELPVTTNADGKIGMVLVTPFEKVTESFPEICVMAGQKCWDLTCAMVEAVRMMGAGVVKNILEIGQAPSTDKAAPGPGIGDLHGVLAVVKIGSEMAQEDWSQLFMFTIMISLDLAIINLLPWPALDGGHLAFMAFEALRGKPMEERAQGEIVKWGFLSLLLLMAVILVNDVRAWVNGELEFKRGKIQKSGQTQPKEEKTGQNNSVGTKKLEEAK